MSLFFHSIWLDTFWTGLIHKDVTYKSHGNHKSKPVIDIQKIKRTQTQHEKKVIKLQMKKTREETDREELQKQPENN